MINYKLVDTACPRTKPYDHDQLRWNHVFSRWTFDSDLIVKTASGPTNLVAERLGLTPNPKAVMRPWEATYRADGNEYEFTSFVLASQSLDTAYSRAALKFSNPIMVVRLARLPAPFPGEDFRSYVDQFISDSTADCWSESQVAALETDVWRIALIGLLGSDAQKQANSKITSILS